MLAPHWWWPPRVRPLLADFPPFAELPGHLYVRGMRALPEYISGVRRARIEATSSSRIDVFRFESARFAELTGHEDLLHETLRRICTVAVPAAVPVIGIHVRRGDFRMAGLTELQTEGAVRTPTTWFVATLRLIRQTIGPLPARVVTDGREADIADLLREPDVQLVRTGAPLGDILTLSSARVLLASGSSFSAWAAFLGGMPTVSHPGQSLVWFGIEPRAHLGFFDPDDPDPSFLRILKR